MNNLFYLLFLFISCVTSSFAQINGDGLINITQERGLPSNEIYCVIKDSKNYIWIGSDQGVVRFNGRSMQAVNNLPDNVVFKIREDNKGRIWFFSRTFKLSYFLNGKIHLFKFNAKIQAKLKTSILVDAYISDAGEIILNTLDTKNYIVNEQTGEVKEFVYNSTGTNEKWILDINCLNDTFSFAQTKFVQGAKFSSLVINKIGINSNTVYNVPCKLQQKFMFYGSCTVTGGEVFFFAGKLVIKLALNGTYKLKLLQKEILTMQYNKKNDIVCVGLREGGVIKINRNSFDTIPSYPELNNKSVTGITFDDEGGEWFTTLENAVYYNKNQQVSKIINGKVFRIYSYGDSVLLFANSKGIFQNYKNKTSQLVKENANTIFDIIKDDDGDVVVSGDFASIKYNNNYQNSFINILTNHKQNIYLVTSSAEFGKVNGKYFFFRHSMSLLSYSKLKSDFYNHKILLLEGLPERGFLFCDAGQQLWMGGLSNLYKYDSNANRFNIHRNNAQLFSKGVNCMQQMVNGIYIIGLRFGGVALIKDSSIIGIITEAEGLLSNSVKFILPIGNSLWLATANGISVVQFSSYNPLKYTVKNFGESAGLNNQIIYQLISYKKNILAATSTGIYQVSIADQQINEKFSPIPLYITSINYYKGDTSGISNISLPYTHNRLVVNFDAVCYNAPQELKHYYRLLSTDTTWYNINTTQIVLENLAPGNYQLQIKTVLPKQQRYSGIQSLGITITRPWWQLNVVRIGVVLLFLAMVFVFYKWRINVIKKKENAKTALKEQMIELEHTALRSQMNPHFIFNCLTSIQQLLLTGNKEEANEYLVKFAKLIRKTLELSAHPYIILALEKDYLTEYVEIEQLRLSSKFSFNFNVDDAIDMYNTEIPNMMLQPIVENCIRHGIKSLKNKKGTIFINIKKVDDTLNCEIIDNGVGRKISDDNNSQYSIHKSYGLEIVQKRLKGLLGSANYFVKVVDIIDDNNMSMGTKVVLQLPFKINT